jgi:trk system potassium uptake protein
MRVIVCGAGQVGTNIARHLAVESNDVTVVDQSPELIQKINDSFDVKGLVGFASHPGVLERAGASEADMLIAVTNSDEVNMVACQVAHSLFKVPRRIARIRQQNYLEPIWGDLFGRDQLPIDVVISPEIEVARAVHRRLEEPGTSETIPLADDKVRLVGVRVDPECPIIHTPLRQLSALFPDLSINVVCIQREERPFVPSANDQILPGDEVYFVAGTHHMRRAMAAFGHEEAAARRIVILGGGNIGLSVAELIEARGSGVNLRVIERDPERAHFIAQRLKRAIVLNGDALETDLLEEANIGEAETAIALTNREETNILSSLLAKRYGCKRTIALIFKATYAPLINPLGIDVLVNPRAITVSTILQHVRRGRIRSVHAIGHGFGEVLVFEALEASEIVGTPLRDVKMPAGALVGAVIRKGEVIITHGDHVVRAGDQVVLFVLEAVVKQVERFFTAKLEYF